MSLSLSTSVIHRSRRARRSRRAPRAPFLPCARALLAFALLGSLALVACGDGSLTPTPAREAPSSSGDPGSSSGDPSNPDGGVAPDPGDGAPVVSGPDTVTVIVEPTDKAQALLDAIASAKTSVHMTMYLLNDKRFIDALKAQHAAGHDVKVLLNHTFPSGAGTNSAVYGQLSSAGIAVAYAPSTFTLTHEKCVIIDGTQAWIMTMNLETTSSTNREFLAVDRDPSDVAEAESIFAADFNGTAVTPTGNLLVAPVNARDRLLALIQGAAHTLDVEGEELSDYKIVDALGAAEKRGVAVRVVLEKDTSPPDAQASAVAELKADGVAVVSLGAPYVHAKAIVADGASAYVGSENFTTASLQYNRELGLITTNAPSAAKVAQTIAADFAAGTPL